MNVNSRWIVDANKILLFSLMCFLKGAQRGVSMLLYLYLWHFCVYLQTISCMNKCLFTENLLQPTQLHHERCPAKIQLPCSPTVPREALPDGQTSHENPRHKGKT